MLSEILNTEKDVVNGIACRVRGAQSTVTVKKREFKDVEMSRLVN